MTAFDRWSLRIGLLLIVVALVYSHENDKAITSEAKNRDETISIESAAQRDVSCEADNETRRQLRKLVVAGRDNLATYRKRGLITKAEYRESIRDQDKALKVLAAVDCERRLRQFFKRLERETSLRLPG